MINCNICFLSKMCKITEEVKRLNKEMNNTIVVDVTKCELFKLKETSTKILHIDTPNKSRGNISHLIKNITNKQTEEDIIISPSEKDYCNCCNTNNIQLQICSKCKQYVCDECSITNITDNKLLCNKCYDTQNPDILK